MADELEWRLINFTPSLTRMEVGGLFEYLSERGTSVALNGDYHKINNGTTREEIVLKVLSIRRGIDSAVFNFETDFDDNGHYLYTGMTFQAIPGYRKEEHNRGSINLLEEARSLTEKYLQAFFPQAASE